MPTPSKVFFKHFLYLFPIFYLSFCSYLKGEKKIYIIAHPYFANNRLFDLSDSQANRDNCSLPFYCLREAFAKLGYILETAHHETSLSDAEHLIVFDIPRGKSITPALASVPKEKRSLFLWEPPLVDCFSYSNYLHDLFGTVFTLLDELVDQKKYKKLFYPQPSLKPNQRLAFEDKLFCAMISGNKWFQGARELYSARRATAKYFEKNHPEKFDLYGTFWNKIGNPSYKGTVKNKHETLKNYKFCICYENSKDLPGYITEKIFDCFIAGTVPVYWGCQTVTNYIPADCFIDRSKFKSDDELYAFLININKEEYEKYSSAIELFLKSESSFFFSIEYFIAEVLDHILPGYDQKK